MNYYLIRYNEYKSLGDGDHHSKRQSVLVKANSYRLAIKKLKLKYKDYILSDFTNLTI